MKPQVRRSSRLECTAEGRKSATAIGDQYTATPSASRDDWPVSVLGEKPPLPDQRMGSNPCGRLARGQLPKVGCWSKHRNPATTKSVTKASGMQSRSAPRMHSLVPPQLPQCDRSQKPNCEHSWDGCLAGVFSEMLELVEAGCCPGGRTCCE